MQIELMRAPVMAGVVVVHAITQTTPASSRGAGAVLMLLHANRDVFFFLSAFVLQFSASAVPVTRFWRRRYGLVLVPYLFWSFLYIGISGDLRGTPEAAIGTLVHDLAWGWFALYFLVVTMQFYAVFPLVARAIRSTGRRTHVVMLAAAAVLQLAQVTALQYGLGIPAGPLEAWRSTAQALAPSYIFWFTAGCLAAAHSVALGAWIRCHGVAILALTVGAAAGAELVYILSLKSGMDPAAAAAALQPVVTASGVGAIAGLWWIGERLLARGSSPRLWGLVTTLADISFGVFLVHVLVLRWLAVPILAALNLDGRGLTSVIAAIAVVLPVSSAVAYIARRTPASLPLTGRPRRPRAAGAVPRRLQPIGIVVEPPA
ncbi:MAG: hypothetical protein QOK05_1537 [Chloroflexota bacterium]|jgi:peptidoglycan/LPS O-acetylase OafA/YrhL|nr:hypothetical protein [Chloroflexota bacterium]